MSEFIAWMRSWLTNKFSIPYIFFFCTFNWPVGAYLYAYAYAKDNKQIDLFRELNHYFLESCPWAILVPVIFTIAYVLATPFINLKIEKFIEKSNFNREILKINHEKEILGYRSENLDLKEKVINKEAELLEKEEPSTLKDDRNTFSRLNALLPEIEILRIFDAGNIEIGAGLHISNPDAAKLKSYVRNAELTDNQFYDNAISKSHDNFVFRLNSILPDSVERDEKDYSYLLNLSPDELASITSAYKEYRKIIREKVKY